MKPVATAILIARGTWDAKTMVNEEELDPDTFLELLGTMALPSNRLLMLMKQCACPVMKSVFRKYLRMV